jgi:hypothetical protein
VVTAFRRAAALALAAGAAALAAACGGPGGGGGDGVPPGPPPALPVEEYMPSPRQIAEDGWARTVLMARCLKRFGIDSAYPDRRVLRGPATRTERRYGTPDAARAREWGYWLPGDDTAPDDAEPGTAENQVSSGTVAEYAGRKVPEGGCHGEAVRALDGPDATPQTYGDALRTANDMELAAYEKARRHPRVRKAEQAWAACMARRGYDLPADVFSASDRLDLPPVRPRPAPSSPEIATAVADAACMGEASVVPVWQTVEAACQREEIAKDPAKWEDVRRTYRAHFENVARVLRENPPPG